MYPPMIGSITLFPYDFEPQDWKCQAAGCIVIIPCQMNFSI
jgi:microcystin-dependent protein